MNNMVDEMLNYPAVNPQTCILAVDNPEQGYCIVPAEAMRRYAESLQSLREDLNWIRGYAGLITADNWRDMKLRIERQSALPE